MLSKNPFRKSLVALLLAMGVGVSVFAALAVVSLYSTTRQMDEESFALKVSIKDEEMRRVYILLAASYADGQPMAREVYGYTRGYIVLAQEYARWNDPFLLYCGKSPDFSQLMLQVSVWDLPAGESTPEDVFLAVKRKPDFYGVIRRADFTYSDEAYLYLPFATITRRKGGHFELKDPTR